MACLHNPYEHARTRAHTQFCPNQCAGNGECKLGFCHCHAGWWGQDCALRAPGQLAAADTATTTEQGENKGGEGVVDWVKAGGQGSAEGPSVSLHSPAYHQCPHVA
jgi:hypothetical protein